MIFSLGLSPTSAKLIRFGRDKQYGVQQEKELKAQQGGQRDQQLQCETCRKEFSGTCYDTCLNIGSENCHRVAAFNYDPEFWLHTGWDSGSCVDAGYEYSTDGALNTTKTHIALAVDSCGTPIATWMNGLIPDMNGLLEDINTAKPAPFPPFPPTFKGLKNCMPVRRVTLGTCAQSCVRPCPGGLKDGLERGTCAGAGYGDLTGQTFRKNVALSCSPSGSMAASPGLGMLGGALGAPDGAAKSLGEEIWETAKIGFGGGGGKCEWNYKFEKTTDPGTCIEACLDPIQGPLMCPRILVAKEMDMNPGRCINWGYRKHMGKGKKSVGMMGMCGDVEWRRLGIYEEEGAK